MIRFDRRRRTVGTDDFASGTNEFSREQRDDDTMGRPMMGKPARLSAAQ